jgi:phosphoribosylaminoimidazole-succinocarboxamide synthase
VIYSTKDSNLYLVKFKPHARSITAKREEDVPKTEYWRMLANVEMLSRLASEGIATNLVYNKVLNIRGTNYMAVGSVSPIQLEWIVRYEAQGSIVREYPDRVNVGDLLPCQFQKISYKIDTKKNVMDSGVDDPTIPDSYILGFGILNKKQLSLARKLQYSIGEKVKGDLEVVGIRLQDMKFELGFSPKGKILLIDEISQDCIRAVDILTGKRLTKDLFREHNSHNAMVSGYEEFARRLNPNIESLIEYI